MTKKKEEKKEEIEAAVQPIIKVSFDTFFSILERSAPKVKRHHKAAIKKYMETMGCKDYETKEKFFKIFKKY
jgi:hypothetical protein